MNFSKMYEVLLRSSARQKHPRSKCGDVLRPYCVRASAIILGALWYAVIIIAAQPSAPTSLLIKAESGTIVWLDNLRYGTVNESGELTINNIKVGTHTLRARLLGKREMTQPIIVKSGVPNTAQIVFKFPATEAEQSFQSAETLREKGKHKDAIPEYQTALKLSKTAFARARVGLARSLAATSEYSDAIAEAKRAVREAATNSALAAEATTVAANTYRSQGLYDEAFAHYEKALQLARNFSPEAHTGLALTYQEENNVKEAINHLQIAAAQSNDTEPIIYYLLGNLLDREGQIKLAVDAYEKYLQLEPNSKTAATTRSLLKQLKRDAKIN